MDEFENLLQTLDKALGWKGNPLYCYHGFWLNPESIRGLLIYQKHYGPKDTDFIIASNPKSGTTWLKALIFSMVNRHRYVTSDSSPLMSSNPHELVPFLELLFTKGENDDVKNIPDPRIVSTHLPHQLLPNTIIDSKCKIVYICRNPLDMFVSAWFFIDQNHFGYLYQLPIDEAFEAFCKGIVGYGPFWDHITGYWQASLKNPNKILFLKYEDLKLDIIASVKKIADFLGFPFSEEEKKGGVVEEITRLCSFEKLKNLEVNKNGEVQAPPFNLKKSTFFRKGKVGDWTNHLSPSFVERLQKLMKEKFSKWGLSLIRNKCKPRKL